MSQKRDQEYFCDGITEEIINALARVDGVRVVARASSFAFKGKQIDVREVGRRLGVENLVEGSVRKAGNRLRISAELISTADGYNLWSERYDREMEDVFAIQDDITLSIVDHLKVTLLGSEKETLVHRHTVNLDAFNWYWKGRFFWNKRTLNGYRRALECFEEAIAKDPSYALAHVGIADCYDLLGWYDYLAPDEAFPKARQAVQRALEMDDRLAEAHATKGWLCVNHLWDWSCGEAAYRRAIELNPDYPTARQWYSEFLSYMKRHDEAIQNAREALRLDPLSIIINTDLGQVFYYAREYERAIEQFEKTIDMAPGFAITHFFLAFAHAQKGDLDQAIAEAEQALSLTRGSNPLILSQLGTLYALSGDQAKALEKLEALKSMHRARYVSPFCVALVHMALGQHDTAFDWLRKAHAARDHWMETLQVHPILDPLRADSRYDALIGDMHFVA
jgi:TolB-like protein/Tfp pilus assembly protein PilF